MSVDLLATLAGLLALAGVLLLPAVVLTLVAQTGQRRRRFRKVAR